LLQSKSPQLPPQEAATYEQNTIWPRRGVLKRSMSICTCGCPSVLLPQTFHPGRSGPLPTRTCATASVKRRPNVDAALLARHEPTSAKSCAGHSAHGGGANADVRMQTPNAYMHCEDTGQLELYRCCPDGKRLGGLHGTPHAEICSTSSAAAANIAACLLDQHDC